MKYMYPFSCCFLCERDILLVRDRELDMRIERYVFFFRDFNFTSPQCRSSQHTHTHKHSHTRDWPTVASGSSGSRGVFSGFAKYFWTTSGQQEFFGLPGGHATSENISSVTNVFSCLCLYFCAGIMLQRFFLMIRF